MIGSGLSLQASLGSCRRICNAINSRIDLIKQEEQELKETLKSNTLSKLPSLLVELRQAIFSFIPHHPNVDYQRHYLHSLRPLRFLYELDLVKTSLAQIQELTNEDPPLIFHIEITTPPSMGYTYLVDDDTDSDSDMEVDNAISGSGSIIEKLYLVCRDPTRIQSMDFLLDVGGRSKLALAILEAAGRALPYLRELRVRMCGTIFEDASLIELQNMIAKNIQKKKEGPDASGPVLKTAWLDCSVMQAFKNAGLLSSVTELEITSKRILSPITLISAPSGFAALQTLDIRRLNLNGSESGLGFNHSKIDLGSLSSLLIPSIDFLDLISPGNKVVRHLGIASWTYSRSHETAEERIARTFPSLQHLEIVSYQR